MNFGSVSPSGIQLLTSPITIRGKNGSKVNITGLRETSNSSKSMKVGVYQNHNYKTPLIFGSQKEGRSVGLIGALDSSTSLATHGHEQSRLYGSNEDINQNYRNNNRDWNDSGFLSISSNSNKSRVPEIHMINKYYGLIPKKFTMHSRHSADQNQRSTRYGTKHRAKSAVTLVSTKKSSLEDSDSTLEYNELHSKVKARRGSSSSGTNRSQEIGDKSSQSLNKQSHVELVTTKMSVERQHKKWRHRRSSSLSLMENGSEQNCHATKAPNSYKDAQQQRVIKIDLNNMSWEETCQSNSPSDEPQSPSPDNSPRYTMNDHRNNLRNPNDSYTTYNDDRTTINATSKTFHNSSTNNNNLALNQHQLTPNSGDSTRNEVEDSSFVVGKMQNQNTLCDKAITGNINNNDKGINSEKALLLGESCGIGTVAIPNDSSAKVRQQRFRKTISFDEQLLRPSDSTGWNSNSSNQPTDPEAMKPSRRPMTASIRMSQISSSHNNQNPTNKVNPWTQRSGGQGMSLSERRAKLQKSVSILSSDSFDYGDGEGSDNEAESSSTTTTTTSSSSLKNLTVANNIPGPNSSAYKETRKSLFFHPPPEIATMVSLVSPIETLEIQYEIEKVAVMLKNMQNQNKSFIDLCPADSSSLSSSKVVDKTLGNSKNDNEFTNEAILDDDINGNPTGAVNLVTPGDKVINSEEQNPCGLSPVKVEETNIGCGGGNTDFGQPQQNPPGPHGVELLLSGHSDTGTTGMDLKQECNLLPSLVEDIGSGGGGRNSIKSENLIPAGSCSSEPISLKVQTLPPPLPTPLPHFPGGARRPPLKKSVSISCEKELLQTPGCQNEVNGNGTFSQSQSNENKGSRPKTAAISGLGTPKPFLLSRSSSTSKLALSSMPISSSNSHRTRPKVSTPNQSHPSMSKGNNSRSTPTGINDDKSGVNATVLVGETNQSQNQALRNRKILIKKALIEINQSSASLGKKYGILGRPKTAPSPGASNNNNKKSVTTIPNAIMTIGQNQRRQPLKASPPQSTGVKPGQPVGKAVIPNQKIDPKGENNAISEDKEETETTEMDDSLIDPLSGNRRTLKRQSFSLDEGLLLGFSNKEFGWNSSPDGNCDEDQEEGSLLSSKKREECLKIYEKMVKTGFAVKLDTIFRGMMTPSEYRAFIKAAETAGREAAEAARAAEEEAIENGTANKKVDAGVNLGVDGSEQRRTSIFKIQTLKST